MKKLMFVLSLICAAAFSAVNPSQVKTAEDVAALPENSKPVGEMVLHLRQNAASYKTYADMKNAINAFVLSDGRKFVDVKKDQTWLVQTVGFGQPSLVKFAPNFFIEYGNEGSKLLHKMNSLIWCSDKNFADNYIKDNIIEYAQRYSKVNDFTARIFNRYLKAVNDLPAEDAKAQLKQIKRIIYPRIGDEKWKPIVVKVELALKALE